MDLQTSKLDCNVRCLVKMCLTLSYNNSFILQWSMHCHC